MARALIVMAGFALLLLSACTQHLICPAYESAFIYDQEALRKKFSYFNDDSTPKVLTASKTKYLVAVPMSYRKKERGLQTVPMKEIKPVVPDSLTGSNDEMSAEDLNHTDSLKTDSSGLQASGLTNATDSISSSDSTYVITVAREINLIKYDPLTRTYSIDEVGLNLDQDYYMWYLRDILVLPDVKLSKLQENGEKEKKGAQPDSTAGKSKREGGFFKNLFHKKSKPDTLTSNAPTKQEVTNGQTQEQPAPKKGGLLRKKKPADNSNQSPKQNPTVPKKEASPKDEGF